MTNYQMKNLLGLVIGYSARAMFKDEIDSMLSKIAAKFQAKFQNIKK